MTPARAGAREGMAGTGLRPSCGRGSPSRSWRIWRRTCSSSSRSRSRLYFLFS
uniref:Uncharacterized protein n=1 Tax=Arundo donax TaxID=35708 RepID=A0A0A9D0S1_ARUDO